MTAIATAVGAAAPDKVRAAATLVTDWLQPLAKAAQREADELVRITDNAHLHGWYEVDGLARASRTLEPDRVLVLAQRTHATLDELGKLGPFPRLAQQLNGLEQAVAGARTRLGVVDEGLAKVEPARRAYEAHVAAGKPIWDDLPRPVMLAVNDMTPGAEQQLWKHFPGGKQWFDTLDELKANYYTRFVDDPAARTALSDSMHGVGIAVDDVRAAAASALPEVRRAADDYAAAQRVLGLARG